MAGKAAEVTLRLLRVETHLNVMADDKTTITPDELRAMSAEIKQARNYISFMIAAINAVINDGTERKENGY